MSSYAGISRFRFNGSGTPMVSISTRQSPGPRSHSSGSFKTLTYNNGYMSTRAKSPYPTRLVFGFRSLPIRAKCLWSPGPGLAENRNMTSDRLGRHRRYRQGLKGGEFMDPKMFFTHYLDTDWRFDFPRLFREPVRFRPSIDVVRKDGQLVVAAELPGLAADDVEVSLESDILTIRGEKADEHEVNEDDRYIHERTFGSFQRRITVPDGVTPDSISARFEDGVLTLEIKLPEGKEREPQRIPVGTGKAS